MLDQKQRADLATELAAVETAIAPIIKAMRPFRKALGGLTALHDSILDKFGVAGEILDCASGCMILPGDRYHLCSDGPYLCEQHAPTYQDCLNQLKEALSVETDEGERLEFVEDIAILEKMSPEELTKKNVAVHDG